MHLLRHLDNQSFAAIHSLAGHTASLHRAAADYASYGTAVFVLLLLVGLAATRSGDDGALGAVGWAGFAALIALAVSQPISHAVREPRPYVVHPHLLVLVHRSADFSFPSDHAAVAGAVAAGLWLAHRGIGIVAGLAAVVMAFDRVYVGAHYPWDVLAGLVLGVAVAVVGWALLRRPLIAVTAWLRVQAPLRRWFAPGRTKAPHPRAS